MVDYVEQMLNFKKLATSIIRKIVDRADANATTAAKTIGELTAKCAAAQALVAQQGNEKLTLVFADLTTFAGELAADFNPTPAADALAGAIEEAPEVVTPDSIHGSSEIDTAEPTPAKVVDDSISAIESV